MSADHEEIMPNCTGIVSNLHNYKLNKYLEYNIMHQIIHPTAEQDGERKAAGEGMV